MLTAGKAPPAVEQTPPALVTTSQASFPYNSAATAFGELPGGAAALANDARNARGIGNEPRRRRRWQFPSPVAYRPYHHTTAKKMDSSPCWVGAFFGKQVITSLCSYFTRK